MRLIGFVLAGVFALGLCCGVALGAALHAQPSEVWCENSEWVESTQPERQGGDRQQLCRTPDAHAVLVVELD